MSGAHGRPIRPSTRHGAKRFDVGTVSPSPGPLVERRWRSFGWRAAATGLVVPVLLVALSSSGCSKPTEQQETPQRLEGSGERDDRSPRPGHAGPPGPPPLAAANRPPATSTPPAAPKAPATTPGSASPETPDAPDGQQACEAAYRTLLGMLSMPGRGGRATPPPRERFLRACAELPPDVQRCLDVTYHIQHAEACRAARDRVDPALRARVQALMAGRAPAQPPGSAAGEQPGQQAAGEEAAEDEQRQPR